ncbi:hypothetical protein CK203_091052 [Vitis vinifera]|uniref:Ubiquitin-like protease family profile domain-containing protein n=1 Tax=Vitis vinifera TaxID=29760 RepID=A0A438BUZ1_VITVI|nr:hypothetical protein CK203_091052 [Vitis vinifera]
MMAFGNMLVEEAKDATTLKFNPRVIQDLEDEDDLDNVVSHSDDFANVYIVESPGVEAIEANIPNTQLALGGPHPTFPSSNASCDANPNTMMLSRGFASRCADSEYTPLESNRFREAILGSGHTFKNADEFRNAIYQMSLAGRFQYKYKKIHPLIYDGMFPLALGVVGSENYEDWQNIRGKKGKEDALLLLDNIAYARLDIDYNEGFEKLVHFNESFNAWLREERHQTIYTLLMMHMDKLVAMLDTHMRGTDKWKSVVGPKTEENLMSNITRSASITVMPYLGGTFKLIYSGQFQPLPTHNMPKVCEAGTLQDGQGNVFPSLQPPQVRRPPGRPRQKLVSLSVHYILLFYANDAVIILTMAGNGLDGSAASSLPLSGTSMFTRCSAARFKKLCNRLPEAKIQAIRDLQFGATDVGLILGLPTERRNLQVTSTSSDHPFGTIRACEEKLLNLPVGEEFRRAFIYYACATLLAPTSRLNGCRNLWHTIHEDGFRNDVNWAQFVLDQLVEGIRRFQQYKTSWVHGCVLFLQLHYVIKFQIPSVQVPITVPPALAWTDDLIKRRLVAEIKEFGAFGHAEIDFVSYACINILASQRSPTVERTMEPETNVDHDTNVDAENSDEIWHQYHDAERAIDQYQRGIQQQLRIMRGLMHKLGTRRHTGVNSDAGGHSSYAPASPPTADDHAFPGDEYMASHAAYHVLDTPDRVVAPEYELQPSVPINVVSDGEEQPEGNVVPTNRNVRRHRVRRMAPNLLSPYISQPQTKQSAIKIDLKHAAALVFGEDLDASEELVSMHDTILTRGNLGCFEGNGWIGNDVVDAYCRLLQYQHEPKSKLFLSPYIAEMVIHSQAKHLVREAVIRRFEPHLYQIDIPYVNVNEVFLPVLIKNHWTLFVYDLANRRIQLLDSRPGRKKTMLSGVQQNLAKVVCGWLPTKKRHDCGVFVMKFMELWSMGGFSKSIDVGKLKHYRLKIMGVCCSQHKCTPRPCPERLKGIVICDKIV